VAWIQVDDGIRDHDKIYNLADTLKITDAHAVGLMVCLWTWAVTSAPDGDITNFPVRAIARAAGWDKKPEVFYAAISAPESRFIESVSGRVMFRNWDQRAAMLMDAVEQGREKTRKRVQRYRQNLADKKSATKKDGTDNSNSDVTPDDNGDVTPCNVTGDVTSNGSCNATDCNAVTPVTKNATPVTALPYHTIPNHTIPNLNSDDDDDARAREGPQGKPKRVKLPASGRQDKTPCEIKPLSGLEAVSASYQQVDAGHEPIDPMTDTIPGTPEEAAVRRVLLEFIPCGLPPPNQYIADDIDGMVIMPEYGHTPDSRADLIIRAMRSIGEAAKDKKSWGNVKGLIRHWQKNGERGADNADSRENLIKRAAKYGLADNVV